MADSSAGDDTLADSYALSSELLTDGEPVRCVSSVPSRSEVLSGSQGGVVSLLGLGGAGGDAGGGGPSLRVQPGGPGTRHPHQIGAILSSSSSAAAADAGGRDPLGVYATGCRDGIVRVMDATTHELRHSLEGHANAVTSLSWVPPAAGSGGAPWLVSGSWDGTARVWRIPPAAAASPSDAGALCMGTIGGHENTVSVAGLPAGADGSRRVVTTSAGVASGGGITGHAVRVWRLTECPDGTSVKHELSNKVSDDHDGPIRDVAYDPDTDSVYTCSNDGTVRVRSAETGDSVATLACPGSDRPMLLSVCVVGGPKSKAVAAGTEDGNVVVWDVSGAGRAVQTLGHPGCVWRVSPVGPSGCPDFISACHDGHIRIFTRDPSRFASSEAIASFEKAAAESKASRSTGPSPEEIAKLPQWEMNALTRGRSEGQVQVFNKSGVAIAAQWSESSGTWIEVGEVTGTNENAGTVDGARYDHVFDVEVEVPAGGVRKLKIGYNNGENPFVVAQKFIDDNMLSQGDLAQIADYIRQRAGASAPTLGMDAGGGGGGGPPAGFPSAPVPMDAPPSYDHIPMRGYKTFDSGADPKGLSRVVSKVRELNASSPRPLPPSLADDALDSLASVLAATSRYHSSSVPDAGLEAVRRMVSDWDAASAFPALDLARIAVLHPDASSSGRRGYWDDVLSSAMGLCESLGPGGCRSEVAVPMLTMRLVANSYRGGPGSSSSAGAAAERALGCVALCSESSNRNVRLGAATALLNATSHMASSGQTGGTAAAAAAAGRAVEVAASMLRSGRYEAEASVRALVAMGTAMLVPGEAGAAARRTAGEVGAGEAAESAAAAAGVGVAAAVAGEIRSVLSSS